MPATRSVPEPSPTGRVGYDGGVAIVTVNVLGSPYDVHVEPGILASAGAILLAGSSSTRVAVLTDQIVGPLHGPALAASLRAAGFEPILATLPPGEANKSLTALLPVYDAFLSAKIERSTPVLALGGGIVCDMAGFVAATLLRGVPFIPIPTTLLAMVDASVGGKTGVNHGVGKNLIGAFHQPTAVLADPAVLRTLPPAELSGGLAECIKHDLIRDADGFANLERTLPEILAGDVGALAELVAHNVRIKAAVVAADPFEHGERAHLNFGHTFGHAVERVSDYAVGHGPAVAVGMVAAAALAVDLGMLDGGSRDRLVTLIGRAGLPTGGLSLDADAVVRAMGYDKKVSDGRLRLVLPDRIGHVVVRDDVPAARVAAAVRRITA
jgi:3-dehydroquinate synthase